MATFGATSMARLVTLDLRLQQACHDAIKVVDFSVLCGHRTEAEQNSAYERGTSKVLFPGSAHNAYPALAVDVAPWPIDWTDQLAFARLAGVIQAMAWSRGVTLRWGGDWDGDGASSDQSFMDLGHLEIVEP